METFDFCPKYMVPKTKPPQATAGVSMNGWNFSSKPKVPYQKAFTVKLQGMFWRLAPNDRFDDQTDALYNARRLELFYERHGTWKAFIFPHPHLGPLECKFKEPVEVPEAIANSGGLIDAFEIQLVENNPPWRL